MAQYLSPRNDYGFKKLFGSKDHKNLTMSFLNAVLSKIEGDLIVEVHFQNTEKFPEPAGGRRSFLDVHCIDQKGKHFIIEMQNEYQSSFFERMIYYTSLVYSRQKPVPFDYDNLMPVISIGVLSHVFNDKHSDVISEYMLMSTKYHIVPSRHTVYYLIELPKFKKTKNELVTDIDKWLFFMQQAEKCNGIPTVFLEDKNFVEAFDILERMAWKEEDLFAYLAAEDAAGREYRIEKGAIERGEKKKAKETACNLLGMNMSMQDIAQVTGLSIEDIETLQKKD